MKLQATKVFTKWLNNNISHFDGVERFDLLDTVEDMYQFLKNRKMEK